MRDKYAAWWKREGPKGRFRYTDAAGGRITDAERLARINALRIPPAWRDVRISPSARAKLQAVGHDLKGRRQYIYHARWVEKQAASKYDRLVRFAQGLPHFRAVTSAHLAEPGLGKEKVLALVTRLIAEGAFRVGGERYARENGSFGISTMTKRHLQVTDSALRFSFVGKRGIKHTRVIPDREALAVVREVKALKGPRLFQYRKADGTIASVADRDINQYLKAVMGPEFSAKDFRTWNGTLVAAKVLAAYGPQATVTARKKVKVNTCKAVAHFLGNTPAIARASYICPKVFTAYESGLTIHDLAPRGRRELKLVAQGYQPEELELLKMLTGEPAVTITLAPEAPVAAVTERPGAPR